MERERERKYCGLESSLEEGEEEEKKDNKRRRFEVGKPERGRKLQEGFWRALKNN